MFALSTLNCTLATATLSEAVAVIMEAVPESVAPAAGEVIETVGGVASAIVEKVMSGLEAELPLASVDCT